MAPREQCTGVCRTSSEVYRSFLVGEREDLGKQRQDTGKSSEESRGNHLRGPGMRLKLRGMGQPESKGLFRSSLRTER